MNRKRVIFQGIFMKQVIFIATLSLFLAGCWDGPDLTHKYYDIKECKKEMSLADDINESERIDMIVVYKSKREMELYRDGEVVKTLPVSLGKHPKGNKIKRGDSRTPEGQYWIRRKLCSQRYYRSLCISYPNPNDTNRAKARGVDPGGDITVHAQQRWNANGYADETMLTRDWTRGCIAVTNEEMSKLWYAVREGVPIIIKE